MIETPMIEEQCCYREGDTIRITHNGPDLKCAWLIEQNTGIIRTSVILTESAMSRIAGTSERETRCNGSQRVSRIQGAGWLARVMNLASCRSG